MPTISQLPAATTVSATDTIPVSQSGTARGVSIGTILQSVQSSITIPTGSLLGRTSLGAGEPEQVDLGPGLAINGSTLGATGLDHASFPVIESLDLTTDLVASNAGLPALLPVTQLRELFSAGQNVAISPRGVISASTGTATVGPSDLGSMIGTLQVTTSLSGSALIPVSQSGNGQAVSYANLLGGLTIDQAQVAVAAADTDTFWVSQGSSLMVRQTLSALWAWLIGKLPGYAPPTVEVTSSITLEITDHNGHLILCSQPVTISPPTVATGGFRCTVINASSGTVSFASGFLSSSGSMTLAPWQSATVYGLVYSAGSASFVVMPSQSGGSTQIGSVVGLTVTASSASAISVSWQAPANASGTVTYTVQYRVTGTTTWSTATTGQTTTLVQISGLAAATSYDVTVQASNNGGSGPVSSIQTVSTLSTPQNTVPAQVQGLTAAANSATTVQLSWTPQSGAGAAVSYTIEYRVSGGSTWTWSLAGITGSTMQVSGLQANTSYDFAAFGVNATGQGTTSNVATAKTPAAANTVSTITWNLPPTGPYAKGSGAIGINAHANPASAAIQFGISTSSTVPPTTWTSAVNVNTDLWGAYVATPTIAGTYFMWAEGTDGSAQTVYATPFTVQ